jgi:hypothetical protein
MDVFALILAMSIVAAAMTALLWKRGRRRAARSVVISEVHQQHVYLFQGGHLSESSVESARISFERSLDSGDLARVDSSLERGIKFAAQVRALTEIGSEAAGVVLERQLRRRVSSDPLEQSWYWLDVACGLRTLARSESLPALIPCVLERELPLSHFLAAEALCFPGFLRLLESPGLPLGASAVRVLVKALAGLRVGVQPHFVGLGRLGEAVETVWDSRPEPADPGAVRVFVEALRLLRRAEHAERLFEARETDRDAFCRQVDRIRALADVLSDYLDEARTELLEGLQAGDAEQANILQALIDLKADTAEAVIPLMQLNRIAARELALESLAHSQDPRIGPFVCREIDQQLPGTNRNTAPMIQAALRVLRRHPSHDAELILLRASKEKNTGTRVAALQSLGWWDPLRRDDVLSCLKQARYQGNSLVLHAAQAALARLGERQALRWFRHQLAGECSDTIHQTIRRVADEGLLLLWPDVDALADADDPDIAFHACEALEQLREDLPVSAPAR